ncbi:hypothetical protein QJQ45_022221, partial [Haematococcus lacustris]
VKAPELRNPGTSDARDEGPGSEAAGRQVGDWRAPLGHIFVAEDRKTGPNPSFHVPGAEDECFEANVMGQLVISPAVTESAAAGLEPLCSRLDSSSQSLLPDASSSCAWQTGASSACVPAPGPEPGTASRKPGSQTMLSKAPTHHLPSSAVRVHALVHAGGGAACTQAKQNSGISWDQCARTAALVACLAAPQLSLTLSVESAPLPFQSTVARVVSLPACATAWEQAPNLADPPPSSTQELRWPDSGPLAQQRADQLDPAAAPAMWPANLRSDVSSDSGAGSGGMSRGGMAHSLHDVAEAEPSYLAMVVQAIEAAAAESGPLGVAAFIAAYAAATVLLIPGSLLTLAAGALYGPLQGTAVVSVASTSGAVLAFLVARYSARPWAEARLAGYPKAQAVVAGVSREGGRLVLLLRLSPLIPFTLLNYALGLTQVSLAQYTWASWLGMLPGTFAYVYLGGAGKAAIDAAGNGEVQPAQLVIWGLGAVATLGAAKLISSAAADAIEAAKGEHGDV